MVRLEVDCNTREDFRAIVVREEDVARHGLKAGDRVILEEPGMECEAILRCGGLWPWVADIIDGTIKDMPVENSPSPNLSP